MGGTRPTFYLAASAKVQSGNKGLLCVKGLNKSHELMKAKTSSKSLNAICSRINYPKAVTNMKQRWAVLRISGLTPPILDGGGENHKEGKRSPEPASGGGHGDKAGGQEFLPETGFLLQGLSQSSCSVRLSSQNY